MGSKSVVKVFKRKDLESSIHCTSELANIEQNINNIKAEKRSRRELVNTVSNWISERREQSRTEEVEGFRKLFGDSMPSLSGV